MPPTDLARGKTPQGIKAMHENNAVQGLIGRTEAILRAARAYLYATAAEVWRDLTRGERHRTASHRAPHRRDLDHPPIGCRGRHRLSYGGRHRGVPANPFERRFRDMHAIAQQIQARDTHYEDVGKAILATDPPDGADVREPQSREGPKARLCRGRRPSGSRARSRPLSMPIRSRSRQDCWHCAG